MTTVAWLIVWACVLGVIGYVYHVAYARGYAAGQYKERWAMARVFNDERQRGLQAQRDIDYLYEAACWQITRQGRTVGQSEE